MRVGRGGGGGEGKRPRNAEAGEEVDERASGPGSGCLLLRSPGGSSELEDWGPRARRLGLVLLRRRRRRRCCCCCCCCCWLRRRSRSFFRRSIERHRHRLFLLLQRLLASVVFIADLFRESKQKIVLFLVVASGCGMCVFVWKVW